MNGWIDGMWITGVATCVCHCDAYEQLYTSSANLLATKPVCEDVATDWLNQDNNTWYMKILTGS